MCFHCSWLYWRFWFQLSSPSTNEIITNANAAYVSLQSSFFWLWISPLSSGQNVAESWNLTLVWPPFQLKRTSNKTRSFSLLYVNVLLHLCLILDFDLSVEVKPIGQLKRTLWKQNCEMWSGIQKLQPVGIRWPILYYSR